MASGHNSFSVTERPTRRDCIFEIYMVEVPLGLFEENPQYDAILPFHLLQRKCHKKRGGGGQKNLTSINSQQD